MDANVEMVLRGKGEEVGPAEELNYNGSIESRLFRQNRLFSVAMLACLVAILLFFSGTMNVSEENIDQSLESLNDPVGEGVIREGLDNSVVAAGAALLKPHLHHSYPFKQEDKANNPSSPPVPPTATDTRVQEWLDAKVTLDDGVKFEVVRQLKHDPHSFTEGLAYVGGVLFESVGMYKQSALLVLDPATGDTLERYDMEAKYFAEGLTYVDGKLIQLTYQRKTGFIYNASNLKEAPRTFTFQSTTGEGWGLTYNPDQHELIMSDGSQFLHFWDPDTLQSKRKVAVTRQDGQSANNINELEFWRGRVLANVWFRDILLVIHPETGIVEKEYGEFAAIAHEHVVCSFSL